VVNTGTLLVNSPGSLAASSAVTVAAGASLGGNGTINGTVNASAGGQLAPGGLGTIGKLTLANNSVTSLTLNGNALFFDLPNTVTTGDLIDITGSGELILNGANFITLNAPNGLVPEGTYTLMTYSARTGSGTLTFQNGATTLGNATINVGPTSVTLTVGSGGLLGWDTWEGNVSGVWDDGALNWKRGGITSSAYVDGDAVTFDDSGSTAATINTVDPLIPVTPASVLFTNNAKNYTVSAVIAGGTTLAKTGSGTTILTGANTYTGKTTVSGGILQLTGAGKLGNSTYAGALDITPGATFQNSSAGTQTLTGIVGTGGGIVSNSSGLILRNANNAYGTLNVTGGRVFIQSAAGALAANSTVNITTGGRLVLEVLGSPTYNQAIAVTSNAAGGLVARNASTLTNVTLPGTGSLTFNSDDQPTSTLAITNAQSLTGPLTIQVGGGAGAPGNVNLSGNITGALGALTKSGAGNLILSGANSYGGATTVSAGTLSVTGSLGASAVTVNSTATLGGNGNIGGNVTIESGATHAIAVAANAPAQVTRVISGTLMLDAGNILTLTEAAPPSSGTYVLATATSIIGTPTILNYSGSGIFSVDTTSSPNRLLLTVVGGANYASWAIDNGIPGAPPLGDFENDGISNLVEYALGTDPKVSTQPAGVLAGNVMTFTKGSAAIANGDVSWAIETSESLGLGSWTPQVTQAAGDSSPTISYTFTPGSPAKNFARLRVIQAP
jgi:fibronectin-binding autotransporter adhesin